MNEKLDPKQEPKQIMPTAPKPKRPNETGSLQIDGFVKIYVPNSREVYVEKRA